MSLLKKLVEFEYHFYLKRYASFSEKANLKLSVQSVSSWTSFILMFPLGFIVLCHGLSVLEERDVKDIWIAITFPLSLFVMFVFSIIFHNYLKKLDFTSILDEPYNKVKRRKLFAFRTISVIWFLSAFAYAIYILKYC